METIIVTGSSGFIGYSLSKYLLDRGYCVIGIDIHNGEGVLKKLQNARHDQLAQYEHFISIHRDLAESISDLTTYFEKSSCVVHLAATAGVRNSNKNPSEYIRNNVVAFSNVIELALQSNIQHFIFASSSSVYGDISIPIDGVTEDLSHCEIRSVYAMTKKMNEIEAYLLSSTTNMKITGLRFFSVYGPFGRPDMAPWIFLNSIIFNQPITLYDEGSLKRDFTYIDDVVHSIYKVLTKNRESQFELYNIGCSSPQTVISLLHCIESILGKTAIVSFVSREPADVIQTFANMSKYKKDYGELSKSYFREMESGIKDFCMWFCKFKESLDLIN